MTKPTTPPGWHPDPEGKHDLRYWDGGQWTSHVSDGGEQSTASDDKARKARLDAELAKRATYGWRLTLRENDFEAVIERGHRPNHLLHLILSLLTLGLWAVLVWLPIAIFGGVKHRRLTVYEGEEIRETEGAAYR